MTNDPVFSTTTTTKQNGMGEKERRLSEYLFFFCLSENSRVRNSKSLSLHKNNKNNSGKNYQNQLFQNSRNQPKLESTIGMLNQGKSAESQFKKVRYVAFYIPQCDSGLEDNSPHSQYRYQYQGEQNRPHPQDSWGFFVLFLPGRWLHEE